MPNFLLDRIQNYLGFQRLSIFKNKIMNYQIQIEYAQISRLRKCWVLRLPYFLRCFEFVQHRSNDLVALKVFFIKRVWDYWLPYDTKIILDFGNDKHEIIFISLWRYEDPSILFEVMWYFGWIIFERYLSRKTSLLYDNA